MEIFNVLHLRIEMICYGFFRYSIGSISEDFFYMHIFNNLSYKLLQIYIPINNELATGIFSPKYAAWMEVKWLVSPQNIVVIISKYKNAVRQKCRKKMLKNKIIENQKYRKFKISKFENVENQKSRIKFDENTSLSHSFANIHWIPM